MAAFAPDDGQEIRPDAAGFLAPTPKGVAEDIAPDLTGAEQRAFTASRG